MKSKIDSEVSLRMVPCLLGISKETWLNFPVGSGGAGGAGGAGPQYFLRLYFKMH